MEQNNEKIITKRSHGLRFTISNLLGGIGISELIILTIGFCVGIGLLIGLAQVNVWLGVVFLIIDIIFSIFLIAPTGNQKLFYFIFNTFKYIFAVKKVKNNEIKAFNIVNKIEGNKIYFNNNSCALIWKIASVDISLMVQNERDLILNLLRRSFNDLNLSLEIMRIQKSYYFKKQTKHIVDLLDDYHDKKIDDNHIANQLGGFANFYDQISNNEELQKSTFYLVVYGSDPNTILRNVKYKLNNFNVNLQFETINTNETTYLWKKVHFPGCLDNEELQIIHQKPNYLKFNNKFTSYLRISEYPLLVKDGWLFPICNLNNIQPHIKINSISEGEAIQLLDKAIMRAYMNSAKKASEQIETNTYVDHFHTLLDLLKNGAEKIKMVDIVFEIHGNSITDLTRSKEALKMELINRGFKIDQLRYNQLDTYRNIFQPMSAEYTKNFCQEMPLTTICSAFPFMPNALNDHNGLFLGLSDLQEPVFFDVKTRNSQGRVNSNVLVLGMTGFGKTYNVSKQINWLYLNQTKIFIIDPEREYHNLAKYYQGEVLQMGKTKSTRINPLEVFGDSLIEHIGMVEQFFRILYPNLIDRDFVNWQKIIFEAYKKKNIKENDDFLNMKTEDFPTLSDLYYISEQQEANIHHKSTLNGILWKLVHGADGKLWNGISTLSLKNKKFIVFDTHELSVNKNIQNAQIFLMLSFLDREIKLNKLKNSVQKQQEWICIAIDEAHLLINENNSLALDFLFHMTKRIRKYNGILYIISQNVNDFLGNETIKTQTQGIINNCSYQFIHHLAPKDLQDYDNLVSAAGRLNEHQKNRITHANQGQTLFVENNQRFMVNIETFDIEHSAWMN